MPFPNCGVKSGFFLKQPQSGLLHEMFGVGSCVARDLRKLRFLLGGEMYFHSLQSMGKLASRQPLGSCL
jgi:hypothetical protein